MVVDLVGRTLGAVADLRRIAGSGRERPCPPFVGNVNPGRQERRT
jgi:hypothetical protein